MFNHLTALNLAELDLSVAHCDHGLVGMCRFAGQPQEGRVAAAEEGDGGPH